VAIGKRPYGTKKSLRHDLQTARKSAHTRSKSQAPKLKQGPSSKNRSSKPQTASDRPLEASGAAEHARTNGWGYAAFAVLCCLFGVSAV
jgi:hypothetical protein